MANILSPSEAATVLRCDVNDADMLALLPLVDAYIQKGTGHAWASDAQIHPIAKSAARILIVLWHENPGMTASGVTTLSYGLRAVMVQLAAIALQYVEFYGRDGEGSIDLKGARIGDRVASVTGLAGVTGSQVTNFETVISVEGQIQQVSNDDLSQNVYRVFLTPVSEL